MIFLACEGDSGLKLVASNPQGSWKSSVDFQPALLYKMNGRVMVELQPWPQAQRGQRLWKRTLPWPRPDSFQEMKKLLAAKLQDVDLELSSEGVSISSYCRERLEVATIWLQLVHQFLEQRSRKEAPPA